MRFAIKLVIGFIALMACTLGLSVVFLATVGDDFFRRLLQHQMAEIIDREVRVDGTVSLDVSLEPTLSVTDVRVANAPWVPDRSFAHLDRAEVQIVLSPLFYGIVHLRRLVLEGLTLRLETAPDGRENWHLVAGTAEDEGEPEEPGDAFYPLLEFISLDDIAVIYEDRQTGWSSELVLERLRKSRGGEDGGFNIEGSGRVNDSWFEIAGLFGSLEDALTAARPYPLELSFELPGLTAELVGTAADLPHAEGFALDLTVTSPSVGDLLEVWEIERAIEGRATLSAHLAGDLEELAVPQLIVDLEGRSGQRLHAEGSIEDLAGGHGLDLRFDGRLVPGTGLLATLPNALRDLDAIALRGRISGDLEQPAIEAFEAKATHASGIEATLAGDAAFNFVDDQPLASALALTADVSVADVTVLEELTGAELPAMGRLEATAEATLDAGQVVRASLRVQLPDIGGLELRAEGPLGKLSAKDFEVSLDPRLALSLSSATSQPLLALADETFPDAGPLRASGELSRRDGVYRIENIQAALGSPGRVLVEVEGAIDSIGLDAGSEPRLAATVQFEWPSSQAIAPYLGQEIVELGRASGSFAVAGTLETIALSEIAIETNASDGLTVRASNGQATLQLADGAHVEDFAIDLAAESTTTKTVASLVGQDLPELGPIRASGRLTAMADTFALAGLTGSLGPHDEPLLQVMGEVRNLADLEGLTLQGSYRMPTADLLNHMGVTTEQPLGSVGGEFELTDADGSLGFETFTAELFESSPVSLSLTGVFDDVRDLDELDFQASLDIPDLEALGLAFDVPGLFPSPLAFEGRVKGSDEAFALTGETKVGETVIPGRVSGSFASPRPSFQADLSSPVLYFADFGLTPEVDATDDPDATTLEPQEAPESAGPHRLFDETPLPFDVLRTFDLALDIRLDELDGVSLDIDSANLQASLTDGLLTVEPLQFNFVGSSVTMRFSVDARSPDAKIRYLATIDDLDLGDLFGQLDANVPVDGELDMVVNVQAEGDTPHALAESLHGEVDLAIQRGHIRSRAFAFTALDLGSWLFAKSTRRGYSELNCFVLRFDVVEGIADTETLFLDTDNVQLFGDGDISLGPETIHIEMDPQPKTRRIATLTTGFTIDGPLASPNVQVSAGGAAIRTIGEIVLTPINLLGRLLPFVNDSGADEDNPCVTVEVAAPADATP